MRKLEILYRICQINIICQLNLRFEVTVNTEKTCFKCTSFRDRLLDKEGWG